jgi:hypothetical protein
MRLENQNSVGGQFMASTLRVGFIGWATLLLLLLFPGWAYGVIGDCNGDGAFDLSDLVFVNAYLFASGSPPVNYADCDCDGFPGVNFGDLLEMYGYIGGPGLIPWPGSDLIAPANTHLMISGKVDGTTKTKTFIFINNPNALDGGLTLPFSFVAMPGEANVDCINITINPIFSGVSSSIDNVGKTFRLDRVGTIPATTNWEVLCEVDFAPQSGGSPGNAVTVKSATVGRLFPLLVRTTSYYTNFKRMLFPRFVPDAFGTIGDLNCDGSVDISDAVYMIAYIFSGGHKPGDPDGDGVPECPGL